MRKRQQNEPRQWASLNLNRLWTRLAIQRRHQLFLVASDPFAVLIV